MQVVLTSHDSYYLKFDLNGELIWEKAENTEDCDLSNIKIFEEEENIHLVGSRSNVICPIDDDVVETDESYFHASVHSSGTTSSFQSYRVNSGEIDTYLISSRLLEDGSARIVYYASPEGTNVSFHPDFFQSFDVEWKTMDCETPSYLKHVAFNSDTTFLLFGNEYDNSIGELTGNIILINYSMAVQSKPQFVFNVYHDLNENCIKDEEEPTLDFANVQLQSEICQNMILSDEVLYNFTLSAETTDKKFWPRPCFENQFVIPNGTFDEIEVEIPMYTNIINGQFFEDMDGDCDYMPVFRRYRVTNKY